MSLRLGIDAGHGGPDRGTRGKTLGLEEKTVTLEMAHRLAGQALKAGLAVEMTRETDIYLSQEERARRLNSRRVDLLLSLHVNGSASAEAGYISSYVPQSALRAETAAICLQAALTSCLGWPDGGVRKGQFPLLRQSLAPAVRCQIGFLSHPVQEAAFAGAAAREQAVRALLHGVLRWAELEKVPRDLQGHPAERAVRRVWALGWMEGQDKEGFCPDKPVTRAELAVALDRLTAFMRTERKMECPPGGLAQRSY